MKLSLISLFEKVDPEAELIKKMVIQYGLPLIQNHIVKRANLKVCGFISQAFGDALSKIGYQVEIKDNGRHTVCLIQLPNSLWSVDLSAAQFMCDLDEIEEVHAMVAQIEKDPWKTIKIERLR